LFYWGAFVWAYIPEFGIVRKARKAQGATDAKSLQVIMVVGMIATFLAFYLAWMPAFQVSAGLRIPCFVAGVALMIGGSLFRRHCFRMLGLSFTGDVRASKDQVIVTRGAYRYLRHPSYTAGIILSLGLGLGLGSVLSAALMVLGAAVGYVYRMNVEEKVLLAAVGEPYRQFMATRKRLIPFVY
jgi:protein-S-isoprenylcysteine O-methyltransferase Ste14